MQTYYMTIYFPFYIYYRMAWSGNCEQNIAYSFVCTQYTHQYSASLRNKLKNSVVYTVNYTNL